MAEALANTDESKSSGNELDSVGEAYSRNGTDDALEQCSDSTRSERTESDADAAGMLEPKDSQLDATPVPKPRKRRVSAIVQVSKQDRRRNDSSTVVPTESTQDEVKPRHEARTKQQEKVAAQRRGAKTRRSKKGTKDYRRACL